MSINASVQVRNRDITEALKILKKQLKRERVWKYDPKRRYCQSERKRKNKKHI